MIMDDTWFLLYKYHLWAILYLHDFILIQIIVLNYGQDISHNSGHLFRAKHGVQSNPDRSKLGCKYQELVTHKPFQMKSRRLYDTHFVHSHLHGSVVVHRYRPKIVIGKQ